MSYILDALRKADAQRVRDPARGIHAQPALEPQGGRPAAEYRTGVWATIAFGTVVLAATAWYVFQDKPPTAAKHGASTGAVLTADTIAQPTPSAAKVAIAALPPAPIAPVPIAPVPIAPVPTAPVPAAPVLSAPTVAPAAPAGARSSAPALQIPARPVPTQSLAQQPASPTGPGSLRAEGDPRNTSVPTMRGGPQPGPGMEPAPAPPPQSNAPATPLVQPAPAIARPAPIAPAPSTPAPLVTGLPPDAPKLAISGGVYSSNISQRMLIVNGQVFSEGSEVGSGVVLEEIKPKSAVLKFRGTRYTVTY